MLFHKCGPTCGPRAALESETSGGAHMRRQHTYTVDLHCHVMVPQIEKLVADRPEKLTEPQMQLRAMGAESVEFNQKHMLPIAIPKMVDLQVISPSPPQYYYWADPDLAASIVRMQNEHIVRTCEGHPNRLAGLGNIALQHPELAVEQLEYAVRQLGLKGVEVSTSVNGLEFERVWARASELGCLVFIHPFGTSLGERVNCYYLQNMIGQPLETTIALSSLIFSGTLDRHPQLRLLAAHGGGYLPYYIGRSNHGYRVRPEAGRAQHVPIEYLRRVWFDSLVYVPQILRQLIDVVGIDRVVVGTDYPFDMGHYNVHALLDSVPDLAMSDRDRILGANALELLGLSLPDR